jgi:N-sulfoglucosamine sulfohydrolase
MNNKLSLSRCTMATLFFLMLNAAAAERPNFLIMIADDLNGRDLGCRGNPDVKTPNLDQFAEEGVTFTRMYNPAATCSPTRHALYTGLYNIRSGAFPNHTRVYDGTKSIFTHLKAMGYRVAIQGKTHVGPQASFPWENLGDDVADLEKTKSFISRDPAQPWLLVWASHDPHGPWTNGPQDLYDPAKITVPPYLHDNAVTRKNLCAYFAEITNLDKEIGALLGLLKTTEQESHTAALFVSEQGSSFPFGGKWTMYDNGVHAASFMRWPGVIAPKTIADALLQYVDVAPTFIDLAGGDAKTIDTGCPNLSGPPGFDGYSFAKLLRGDQTPIREYAFAQHTTLGVGGAKEAYPSRLVLDGRYSLVRNLVPENTFSIGGIHKNELYQSWEKDAANDPAFAARFALLSHRPAVELFDLENDPYEMHNLADNPEFAPIQKRLQEQLDGWMKQQGDQGLETEKLAPTRQGKSDEGGGDEPKKKKKDK